MMRLAAVSWMVWLIGNPCAVLAKSPEKSASPEITPAVQKAYPFDLNQVHLLEGPFKRAQELERQFLLKTDIDQLLYPFRREAKLPNPSKGSDDMNWPYTGHFMGHYLSGCALMYRNLGDQELKKRADGAISALAECQVAMGTGFIGGFPERSILVLEGKLNDPAARAVVPWYCLHKIYAGLLDMYTLAGNRQSLEVLEKAIEWADKNTAALSEKEMQQMLNIEHGGMNELLANLYAVTGKEKYLKLSLRFNHKALAEPLAEGRDVFDGLHANTTIPKFTGLARQYQLTSEPALLKAARNFWDFVVQERSYVTGGNSQCEFFSSKANLSAYVHLNTSESCNEYNMLKLARNLFCIEPRAEYADYFERTLLNHILSTQHPETGGQVYYQQLESGQAKGGWGTPNTEEGKHYSCCQGTSLESNSKYPESIYFTDGKDGLFVNLYIASVLDWKSKHLTLRQETQFPDEATSRFVFTCKQPVALTLSLRRPWWATESFELKVNGKPQATAAAPGSFIQIKRTWKSGDIVEVKMPTRLHTEGFKDDPKRVALLAGPVVLATTTEAGNPFSAMVSDDPDPSKAAQKLQPVAGKPMEFTGSPEVFRTSPEKPKAEAIKFKPLFRMVNEPYVVYWDHFSAAEFAKLPEAFEPEIKRHQELESRTVDLVLFGLNEIDKAGRSNAPFTIQGILLDSGKLPRGLQQVSEKSHRVTVEKDAPVMLAFPRLSRYPGDLPYRTRNARFGSAVSYEMKVLADQPQELQIRAWHDGSHQHGRSAKEFKSEFEILVNNQSIGKCDLKGEPFDQFVDVTYPLPPELVKDQQKVTVTLKMLGDSHLRGLYESRVLKK